MEEPKKRCPKGTRRNKEGICVPTKKSSPSPSPKSPKPIEEVPTENIQPKRKLIVKKNTKTTKKQSERMKELQEQFKEDIIVPVGNTAKCPKGTRRNKEKQCILTNEFKDTFIKRKACIQAKRDEINRLQI